MRSFPRSGGLFNLCTIHSGVLAILLVTHPAGSNAEDLVRVRGTEMVVGDRPFRFVGVNAAAMHGPERLQAGATIRDAARRGFSVVRLWALGEGEPDAEHWRRDAFLFRLGPAGWVSNAFDQLDTVVATAREVGVRLVVVLANSWGDYGGIPQYLRWIRAPSNRYGSDDRFYTDPRAFDLYAEHVRRVVGRTNERTGVPLRDDPTILSWELVNESHVSRTGNVARHEWAKRAAALVKSIDPNHLVTIGHGGYRVDGEREAWIRDHQIPEIDYCDHHFYLEKVGGVRRVEDLYDRIDDRAQLARFVVRKPFVVGEFGFDNQSERWLGLTRAELHERVAERALADGASGILAWIYLPPGITRRRFPLQWGTGAHDDVLDALGRVAARARDDIPRTSRLGEALGKSYLYPRFVVAGRANRVGTTTRRGDTIDFTVGAMEFHRARWETFGTWSEREPAHAWGAESGYFEYAFALPRSRPAEIGLEARISSEFPGALAPPDGTSRVRVSLEGVQVGEWTARADDGRGRTERLVTTDPAALARLGGGIVHLRLEVEDGEHANGLCVYDPGVTMRVRTESPSAAGGDR